MKKCPKCNKTMSDSSAFCDACGTPLKDVASSTEILESISTVPTIPEKKDGPKPNQRKKKKKHNKPTPPPPQEPNINPMAPTTIPRTAPEPAVEKKDFYIEEEPFEEPKQTPPPKRKKSKDNKKKKGEGKTNPPPKTEPKEKKEPETVVPTKPEVVTTPKETEPEILSVESEFLEEPVEEEVQEPIIVSTEEELEEEPEIIAEETVEQEELTTPETEAPTEPVVEVTTPKTEAPTEPVVEVTPPKTEAPTEPVVEVKPQQPEPSTLPAMFTTPTTTVPETTPYVAPSPVMEPLEEPQIPADATIPEVAVLEPTALDTSAPETSAPVIPSIVTNPPVFPHPQGPYIEEAKEPLVQKAKEDKKDLISLIMGIASIVLCGMPPLAIAGLVFGFLSGKKQKYRKIAIIVNCAALVIGLIFIIFMIGFMGKVNDSHPSGEQNFYGEGYTLTYDENWSLATLQGGNKALKYREENAYFSPIGQANLSETFVCDFDDASCKKNVYDQFYEYWHKTLDSSLLIVKDASFVNLKDDIYYATYNYSLLTTGEQKGKYYLLVSKEKNAVLSFLTNTSEEQLPTITPEVYELLQTIEITSREENSSQGENKAWNTYSSLRTDALGTKKSLSGEYRILSDNKSYWVFKNGEFWWYNDENNKNDNYWQGTISSRTGKNGLKALGLPESKLEEILDSNGGKVSASDVYSVIMVPKKIVSGGIDKSSTNIRKGEEWKFVWILIDHGNEGVEAQVLSVDTSDTYSFVKVKD